MGFNSGFKGLNGAHNHLQRLNEAGNTICLLILLGVPNAPSVVLEWGRLHPLGIQFRAATSNRTAEILGPPHFHHSACWKLLK